ncbi:MAG TPA: hypothetical protein VGK92_13005 [Gaiellales bacterium]
MTEQRPSENVYDAGDLPPDARAVETLARLQLDARRRGQRACVRGASSELQELLAFCGLSFVLGVEAGLGADPAVAASDDATRLHSTGSEPHGEPDIRRP